jgi:hypothetical protein
MHCIVASECQESAKPPKKSESSSEVESDSAALSGNGSKIAQFSTETHTDLESGFCGVCVL